jgi:hypothetical protein
MKDRKICYIDVSNMSQKEVCDLLRIEYAPWYKSSFFWLCALMFSMPSILMMIGNLK